MKASENQKSTIHKKSQSVDLLKKIINQTTKNKFNSPQIKTKAIIINTQTNSIKINNKVKSIPNNNNNNSSTFNKTFLNFNFNNSTKRTKKPNIMSNTSTSNFFSNNNKSNSPFLNTINNNNFLNNSKKTNSNFQLCEFQRKFHLENPSVPYDKYHKSTREIMSEYKYESLANNAPNILEKRLFVEDENFEKIKKDIYKNDFKSTKQTLIEPKSPEAKMKVSVYQEEYKSPEKAFSVIWKNKIIHESMIKNYHERQKTQYADFLKKVSEIDKFTNTTHKRLKVTNSLLANKGLDEDGIGIVNFNSGNGNFNYDCSLSNANLNAAANAEENCAFGTPQARNSMNFTAGAFSPINKSKLFVVN